MYVRHKLNTLGECENFLIHIIHLTWGGRTTIHCRLRGKNIMYPPKREGHNVMYQKLLRPSALFRPHPPPQ